MEIQYEQVFLADGVKAFPDVDGSRVTLEFTLTDVAKPLPLSLSVEAIRELHHHLGRLLTASFKDPAPGEIGFVRMTDVTVAEAQAPADDPGHVAMKLTADDQTVHFFRLALATSQALRPQLRSAEARAAQSGRLPSA